MKSVVLMAPATETQVHCVHAFATRDISGTMPPPLVKTQMSVFLAPMTVCHQPDASTFQGLISASVHPLLGGPLMEDLATIQTSVNSQMCATHKLRASITQEDLNAVVT